ncbi:MAG: hypothetical protein RL508_594 [Actinomycetota bacterium]|jgi:hypothetical protein
MAKNTNKRPSQFAQIRQVWGMTIREDKQAGPISIGAGLLVLLLGIGIAMLNTMANPIGFFLWIILGIVGGAVVFAFILGKRAEKVAYARIEGQPGAVGAVLGTLLKRGWSGSEEPVAVNAKSKDLVYRISGRGGVVLIAEGHRSSVSKLVEDERRKLNQAVAGVPVNVMWVCNDEHSVSLTKLASEVNKLKKVVARGELSEINKRLATMRMNIPVPKGMDPTRMRAGRRMQ